LVRLLSRFGDGDPGEYFPLVVDGAKREQLTGQGKENERATIDHPLRREHDRRSFPMPSEAGSFHQSDPKGKPSLGTMAMVKVS
jgi:hypothetical protein